MAGFLLEWVGVCRVVRRCWLVTVVLWMVASVGSTARAESRPLTQVALHAVDPPARRSLPRADVQAALAPKPWQLHTPVAAATATDDDMPWMWRELRDAARARLPTAETETFCARVRPTVVVTPFNTVPGLGVEGHF